MTYGSFLLGCTQKADQQMMSDCHLDFSGDHLHPVTFLTKTQTTETGHSNVLWNTSLHLKQNNCLFLILRSTLALHDIVCGVGMGGRAETNLIPIFSLQFFLATIFCWCEKVKEF